MAEFPLSLLEVLLEPDIGDEVLVEELPRNAIPITTVINSLLDSLVRKKNEAEADRSNIQSRLDRGEINPHSGHTDSQQQGRRDIERLQRLPTYIKDLDRAMEELTAEIKSLDAEGYYVSKDWFLPSSVIDLRIFAKNHPLPDSLQIGVYPQYHKCPFFTFLKLRPINILSLTELLHNLPEYEGKTVITQGVLIGQGHESHDFVEEAYSYTTYTRLFILEDPKTYNIIEIKEPKSTGSYLNFTHPISIRKIIPINSEQNRVVKTNPSDLYAYLDASKIKGQNIIIGGLVKEDKLVADMFVTHIGNDKQIFTYVIDTTGGPPDFESGVKSLV